MSDYDVIVTGRGAPGERIGGRTWQSPFEVTGAAGRAGAVGRTVTKQLLKQGKPVRAMVRNEDERAQALRDMGAEVVVGDLLDLDSMYRVIAGCETMYFGMSVSDAYLAATVNAAAVAKHHGVKAFINISQMSIRETTASPPHKLHWLAEQALNWSGLPVVQAPPTVFLEGFSCESNQTTVRRGEDLADHSRRRCTSGHRTARQSAAAHRQGLSPDRSAVPEHVFLCTRVFEGAWPQDHLSGHSGRVLAGRAARARLAGTRDEDLVMGNGASSAGELHQPAHGNGTQCRCQTQRLNSLALGTPGALDPRYRRFLQRRELKTRKWHPGRRSVLPRDGHDVFR